MFEFRDWILASEDLPPEINIDFDMKQALTERLSIDMSVSSPVLARVESTHDKVVSQIIAVYSHRDCQWLAYSAEGKDQPLFQKVVTHWRSLPVGNGDEANESVSSVPDS